MQVRVLRLFPVSTARTRYFKPRLTLKNLQPPLLLTLHKVASQPLQECSFSVEGKNGFVEEMGCELGILTYEKC